jgi:hypothetical protein
VEFHAFNCKIEVLPDELARCKVLTKIMVAGNRLSSLPDAVCRSAVRAQLEMYFRALFHALSQADAAVALASCGALTQTMQSLDCSAGKGHVSAFLPVLPGVIEQLVKLLQTGKTDMLDKFVSMRTRRAFKAMLAWDAETGKVGFEFAPSKFPPRKPAPGKTPAAAKAAPAARKTAGPAAKSAAPAAAKKAVARSASTSSVPPRPCWAAREWSSSATSTVSSIRAGRCAARCAR